MCGIQGFIGKCDQLLSSATNVQTRRGPDAHYIKNLAQGRLEMFRLMFKGSLTETIPYSCDCSSEKVSLIFNGEIYNHAQLRIDELGNSHHFKNLESDGEFLAHYLSDGNFEKLNRLEGMFAIAIFYENENKLVLIRDQYGKKPLSYRADLDGVSFSSVANSLYSSMDKLNFDFFVDFFEYGYSKPPLTPSQSVFQVAEGSVIECRLIEAKIQITNSRWVTNTSSTSRSIAWSEKKFLSIFSEAIEKRLPLDRNPALFLSGGIDSSLIAAVLIREFNIKPNSFTYSSKGYVNDESSRVRLFTEKMQVGVNFVDSPPSIADFIDIAKCLDFPVSDTSLLPTFKVSKAMHDKGVRVALSGDGADEFFGGYPRFFGAIQGLGIRNHKGIDFKYIFENRAKIPVKIRSLFDERSDFASYLSKLRIADITNIRHLLNTKLIDSSQLFKEFEIDLAKKERISFSDKRNIEVQRYLPGHILTKIDRAAMFNSVEVRSPFLDAHVIDFALELGEEELIKGAFGKLGLRNLLSTYMNDNFAYQRKTGFGFDYISFIQKELVPNLEILLETDAQKISNILRISKTFQAIEKFKIERVNPQLIWNLGIVAYWVAGCDGITNNEDC